MLWPHLVCICIELSMPALLGIHSGAVDNGSLGVLAVMLQLGFSPSPVPKLPIRGVHSDSEQHQSADKSSQMPELELLHEQVGQTAGLEEDEQHAKIERREQQSGRQVQRHRLYQRGEMGGDEK